MTRRVALPSLDEVRAAIGHLAEAAGKPPTVVALARHLGLANTTFRRNFPDITTDLHPLRSPSSPEGPIGVSQFEQLKRDNDKLRRNNHDLTEHLEIAVANIQRLTLDNDKLQRQLEAAADVTRINTRY
ncbi:hypothetical protein [Amycolatopsis albispora]|uniref:Uncharacterized protein n=1 Tax=Amycolatopsis albispora TaxID=1804986 RepID=A0A344LB49_9PSEU|nr:hypothetical protein [Amycolatopsis albispora]AXB45273.1 hypothetical protein A4R43_24535 [Amycolatopsis albispora]